MNIRTKVVKKLLKKAILENLEVCITLVSLDQEISYIGKLNYVDNECVILKSIRVVEDHKEEDALLEIEESPIVNKIVKCTHIVTTELIKEITINDLFTSVEEWKNNMEYLVE
jgi:hypothetical protein